MRIFRFYCKEIQAQIKVFSYNKMMFSIKEKYDLFVLYSKLCAILYELFQLVTNVLNVFTILSLFLIYSILIPQYFFHDIICIISYFLDQSCRRFIGIVNSYKNQFLDTVCYEFISSLCSFLFSLVFL
jgi:hypothetical protein